MRLTINGRFLTQSLTGVQRYAFEISRAIGVSEATDSAELLVPAGAAADTTELKNIAVRAVGHLKGHAWEQISFPAHSRGILLNLCNTYPILARRQVVVIHDASIYAVPQGYSAAFVAAYRFLFSLLKYKSTIRIVTDSEFSRRQISRYTGLESSRINVIYCGADHWKQVVPDFSVLERLGISDQKFVMAVASDNPNKNLARLVRAFESIPDNACKLVLVGGRNRRVFSEERRNESEQIVRAGYVTDTELAALYSTAICFTFPSLYEGFGLPPLEAMTFGCPVISSREASLPEVCGNAALYCDAHDESDIARKLIHLIGDAGICKDFREAGYLQVQKFKWSKAASALTEIARGVE